jgi:hypothetical protein
MSSILALDLATTTGWATNHLLGGDFALGQITLAKASEITAWRKKGLDRRKDPRFHRLVQHIMRMSRGCSIVVFEDVKFSSYTFQAQLWPTWRAAVWTAVPEECLECVPTNVLKQFATGHGGATKEAMLKAMMNAEPGRFRLDNKLRKEHCVVDREAMVKGHGDTFLTYDAVDAYWLYRWAKENITR